MKTNFETLKQNYFFHIKSFNICLDELKSMYENETIERQKTILYEKKCRVHQIIRYCNKFIDSLSKLEKKYDPVLDACKLAYRKHWMGDDSIGWSELGDTIGNVLAEAMGDEEFCKWLEQTRSEIENGNDPVS